MANTSFFKRYTDLEILKYAFEHTSEPKSYITYARYQYYWGRSKENQLEQYQLYCAHCDNFHLLSELTFDQGKVVCTCGSAYGTEDLKPDMSVWASRIYKKHNLKNGTLVKVSVPTLISKEHFYCPHCRTTQKLIDMPIENKQRVCTCGKAYSFEEIKLVDSFENISTFGDIFFDEHKITVALAEYRTSMSVNGNFYWQNGRRRLTMNLETGFSYMTNTGCFYTEFNGLYRRRSNGKNAPRMINVTYSSINDDYTKLAKIKFNLMLDKYKDYENLTDLMQSKSNKLTQIIFNKYFEAVDKYMTNYYNNKFNYFPV